MVKIKMAFRNTNNSGDKNANNSNTANIDMVVVDPSKTTTHSAAGLGHGHHQNNLNLMANFGEYQDFLLDPNALVVDEEGDATGFAIPIDLNQMSDAELAERWVLAEQQYHPNNNRNIGGGDGGGGSTTGDEHSQQQARNAMMGSVSTGTGSYDDPAVAAANQTLETASHNEWSQLNNNNNGSQTQTQPEEEWQAFDPDAEDLGLKPDDDDDDDDEAMPMNDDSRVSDVEVARAADRSSILSENQEVR